MGKPAKYVLKPLRTSLLDKLARHKRKLDQLFLNAKEELIRLRSVPNLAPGDVIRLSKDGRSYELVTDSTYEHKLETFFDESYYDLAIEK